MSDKKLIKKIKELKSIQPSSEWLNLTRHNLVSQINFEEEAGSKTGFFILFTKWLKQPQSAALTACLLLIFVGGPWLMVKASQASLPGETLYSVKKISEGVQTTVASGNNKAKLQVEFASRRLEELNKISTDSFSTAEKTEKTKQIVSDFKDKLASVGLQVNNISKEEVVVVAKKTKKLKEDLARTKEEMPLDVKDDLVAAEKAIEEISHQILTVLVKESQENPEGTATTTLDKETLIFLEETDSGIMTTTEEIINEINEIKE